MAVPVVDTTPLDSYQEPPPSAVTAFLQTAGITCDGSSLNSIQNKLRKTTPVVQPGTFQQNNLVCHRVAAALHVGSDLVHDDVDVQPGDPSLVVEHGHGNPLKPAGVSLFVPLAAAPLRYAHQVMLAQFGTSCFVSSDPGINGTYIVADKLAIRTTNAFGIHLTLSVSAGSAVSLADLQGVAHCQNQNAAWLPCCIKGNGASDPMQRPPVDDLDSLLILHLLDLVATHSPNHQDGFMAAYYSYILAEFIQQNPGHFEEDDDNEDEEESKFAKLLKFGGDDMILALVIKAAAFLGLSKATTSNYFTLEMIVGLARQIMEGVSLVCYGADLGEISFFLTPPATIGERLRKATQADQERATAAKQAKIAAALQLLKDGFDENIFEYLLHNTVWIVTLASARTKAVSGDSLLDAGLNLMYLVANEAHTIENAAIDLYIGYLKEQGLKAWKEQGSLIVTRK